MGPGKLRVVHVDGAPIGVDRQEVIKNKWLSVASDVHVSHWLGQGQGPAKGREAPAQSCTAGQQ